MNIIRIGGTEWAVENLGISNYHNGDLIPQVQDAAEWANLHTGAWCYYENNHENGSIYGKLYNWFAVNDSRGLAPEGWRIPYSSEWEELITFLGGEDGSGGEMKETGTVHWLDPNVGATNKSCFSARPGGFRRYTKGTFGDICRFGGWWSGTDLDETTAYFCYMQYDAATARCHYRDMRSGLSVRCIKR